MNRLSTAFAALLLGLIASGHCMVMCGGIGSALAMATARDARGRPRRALLVGYQLGRIASYTLAGVLVGGIGGSLVAWLDAEPVRIALRVVTAATFVFAAAIMLGLVRDPSTRMGSRAWSRLAPLARRLLPVATLPRAFAFGALWGWMPCGFAYTVLLVAASTADAWHAGVVMLAFGAGTLPALLATSWGAGRLLVFVRTPSMRRAMAGVLVGGAVLTLVAPWLLGHATWLHAWLPFDCAPRVAGMP